MKGSILRGLLCVVALFSLIPANAQVKPIVRLGVAASTLSNIGDLYDNDCISVSYVVGGSSIIPIKGIVDIQPELNLIRKGRYDNESVSGIRVKTLQYINYIQVPILLRITPLSLTEGLKSKVFFNIGPYGSMLLNAKSRVKTGGKSVTTDQKDNFQSSDFGLIIGSGVQFPFKTMTFQFDLRYDTGLTKVSEVNEKYNTKSLSLAFGVLF